MTSDTGPLRFARYAYPPNALGYCGPDDAGAVIDHLTHAEPGGLRPLLRAFDGAWPYLELVAAANRIADPLDERVVEAYWVGNGLLDRVRTADLGHSLEDRFRARAGRDWERLAAVIPAGGLPHHSAHVFCVYPWVGLLRAGAVDAPLHVLDRCRIRWGQVRAVVGDRVVVRCRPLTWDGHHLRLAPAREETAVLGDDGRSLAGPVAVGDWCTLHWDWVCERVDLRQLAALRRYTARHLAIANQATYPAPAAVLA